MFLVRIIGLFLLLTARNSPCLALISRDKAPQFTVTSLVLPGAVISDINTIHIPFFLTGRLITVEGRIGHVVGNFFFDTGAERLILNRSYFESGKALSSTALGSSGIVDLVQKQPIDTLYLDRLFMLNLNAHVIDLAHIEAKKNIQIRGIIGYDVFKDFEILIDYRSRIITLSRLDNSGRPIEARQIWELKSDSIHFFLRHHMITFAGDIGGKKLIFMLDTGAELNLLDRLVGKRVLRHFEILKRVKMSGVGKKEVEVLAGLLKDLKCADQEPEAMHTLLTNLDEMNQAFGTQIQGVLGYEFLQNKRILINYKKEQLYFLIPNQP
ncbi:MAG: aspartyl protease family protein [Saprospiraceae bacterium]|nr:aspartyl protease family protein [Saprospiraceae bacterium]